MKAALLGMFVLLKLISPLSGSDKVSEAADRELDDLLEVYRHLHQNPELSYQERETAAFLTRRLTELGFAVEGQVGVYDSGQKAHGLVAVLKNGEGPTVMVRTDLDALPVVEQTGIPYASRVRATNERGEEVGVMHACGHDIHMTSFLGTAALLSQMKDRWSGTLIMIGQPAEERGAGARAMLKDGLYSRFGQPDFALALHASASLEAGKIAYRPGYALANVDTVDILLRGRGGHGAYPHTTRDPIVLAAQVVTALQTIVSREVSPLDSAVVTVGSIHGGSKHNIIPDDVRLQLTVRSYKPEVRRRVLDSIRRITEGLANSMGFTGELKPEVGISEEEYTPATYNDPKLSERLAAVFKDRLGSENVLLVDPVMGGEDFGRYTLEDRQVPIFIFWLGAVDSEQVKSYREAGETLPSLHSSEFIPRADVAVRTGVEAMTAAVLELMGSGD